MACRICENDCEESSTAGGRTCINCGDCGEYEITTSAEDIAANHRVDVEGMWAWLEQRRAEGDKVPLITSYVLNDNNFVLQ